MSTIIDPDVSAVLFFNKSCKSVALNFRYQLPPNPVLNLPPGKSWWCLCNQELRRFGLVYNFCVADPGFYLTENTAPVMMRFFTIYPLDDKLELFPITSDTSIPTVVPRHKVCVLNRPRVLPSEPGLIDTCCNDCYYIEPTHFYQPIKDPINTAATSLAEIILEPTPMLTESDSESESTFSFSPDRPLWSPTPDFNK